MKIALLIGGATLLAWTLWAIFGFKAAGWLVGGSDLAAAGQWGDTFGAFNALISGFGFVAVILTLRSQSQALEVQQAALKQQQDDLYRQRFETTFFELLKLLRECRQEVELRGYNVKGLTAFSEAVSELQRAATPGVLYPADSTCDLVEEYSTRIHRHSEATISPYFRVIYRILHRLREDRILSRDEKLSYAKLLRGQLSSDELHLIGFNGKLALARDFSSLIDEYRLLKYLPSGPLKADLEKRYPSTAFLGHE